MNKLIHENLRQDLINYLARRPYHEVYEFIPQLEMLPVEKNGEGQNKD